MNKRAHRLVFDRRRGMRVPAAECCRSAGKAAGGQSRSTTMTMTGVLGAMVLAVVPQVGQGQTADATRGAGASGSASATRASQAAALAPQVRSVSSLVQAALNTAGRANLPTYTPDGQWLNNKGSFTDPAVSDDGKIMRMVLNSGSVILNWDSFNLGAGYTLQYDNSTGTTNRVLNRTSQGDASLLDGRLYAPNTEVMIQNGAGVIFGKNFRSDTNSLIATALKVSDAVFEKGIRTVRDGSAVFGGDEADVGGFVSVQKGAEIRALAGGDVIMVAPRVDNDGLIETPEGQTILAAGKTVYLYAPLDIAQRGLLVAVDNFSDATLADIKQQADQAIADGILDEAERPEALGTVVNNTSGQVRADKGTINLVGAAIRQKGHLTATTAVKGSNGAIFLTAMKDTATLSPGNDQSATVRIAGNTGTVVLDTGSVTEVLPSVEGLVLTAAEKQAVAQALSQPEGQASDMLDRLKTDELSNLTAVVLGDLLSQYAAEGADQAAVRDQLNALSAEALGMLAADNLAALNGQVNRSPNDVLKDAFKTAGNSTVLDLNRQEDRDKLSEVALVALTKQALGSASKDGLEGFTLKALQTLTVADKTRLNDVALTPVFKQLGTLGVKPAEVRRVVDKPVEPKAVAASATAAEKLKFAVDKQNYDTNLALYEDALQQSSDTYFRSRVNIIGKDINLRTGATVQAPGGEVNVFATSNWSQSPLHDASKSPPIDPVTNVVLSDGSSLTMEAGARIDVSGLDDLRLPSSRHQLDGRLFSIELADSPVQRNGVIYRGQLLADARRAITIGDVSGLYSTIRYSAAEYSTAGGLLRMQSMGSMLLDKEAEIDFSGGRVTYDAGPLISSVVLRNGLINRIDNANASLRYDSLQTGSAGQVVPAQVVGMSAGAALLTAPVMSPLVAKIDGSVTMSDEQRLSGVQAGRSSGQLNPDKASQSLEDLLQPYDKFANGSTVFDFLGNTFQVTNRPYALSSSPSLYASLRPTAGYLQVGQFNGYITQTAIQVTAQTPEVTALPADAVTAPLVIPTQTLERAQLAVINLQANKVTIGAVATDTAPADQPSIRLAAGGAFKAKAYGPENVAVNANIVVPGGTIDLSSSTDLIVHAGARLDVAGTVQDERYDAWAGAVKDESTGQNLYSDSPATHGGTVKLSAGGSVALEGGSEVDVSGSTWRSAGGTLAQGNAGTLSVEVNRGQVLAPTGLLKMDATLSAYDASKGGTLKLAGLAGAVMGQDALAGVFEVDSGLYADRGFGKLDVSTFGQIDIAAGARIAPKLVNKVAVASRSSGAGADSPLYDKVVLDDGRREPIRVSLAAQNRLFSGDPLTDPAALSHITVGQGAVVDVGLGGELSLTAGGSIDMAGTLQALGGNVSLAISGDRGGTASSTQDIGYVPEQRIHLADGSLIDVSGAVKRYTTDAVTGVAAKEVGKVLAGGTITLGGEAGNTVRGRLVMDDGATLRLNGASAWLDLTSVANKTYLSAPAGALNIVSTDGFELLGTVQALAPDASVAGGRLNLSLSQGRNEDFVASGGQAYPTGEALGEHRIRITDSAANAQVLADADLKFGEGVLHADILNTSGFDRLNMRADANIQLNAGVDIRAGEARSRLQSVVLNTSVIEVTDDAAHTVQAHHVAFGPSTQLVSSGRPPQTLRITAASERAAQGALGGDGALTVQAGLVEVVGDTAVLGVNKLTLDATLAPEGRTALTRRNGEIRFLGQSGSSGNALKGQLSFTGDLTLRAGQSYATTLSDFGVIGFARNGALGGGTVQVSTPEGGSTSLTPLSALATLRLNAGTLAIDGTLRQPFGTLALQTNTLVLGDNAAMSVSADGTQVPVGGTLNNGGQWVYNTQGVVDGNGAPLPAPLRAPDGSTTSPVVDLSELPLNKQITLNGEQLTLSNKAAVDVSAGGDILAWEFKAGVGGSTDTYLRPDVFAIVPGYGFDFAPYDREIRATTNKVGTTLQAGDQVNISTDSGVLAAGTYTLMDARYGILPGAVLVSAASFQSVAPLRAGIKYDDGSVLVSGHFTRTGTAQNGGNDPRLTLLLEPKATFDSKSEVTVTSGNAYQAAKAARDGVSLALPGDAGRISLVSTQVFDWAARFNLAGNAQAGFSAGQFDLSMPDMVVQTNLAQPLPNGMENAARVSLTQLNALGADSILLGGLRTTNAEDGSIKVERTANKVYFQAATDASNVLSTPGELLAVAKDSMTLDNGLTIESTGADTGAQRNYVLQGDGASLQVGYLANTNISGVGGTASGQGDLSVGSNSAAGGVLLKGNAVQMEATGKLALADAAQVQALTFSLGGQRIAVGNVPEGMSQDGVVEVSGGLLAAANQAKNLKLRAYTSIDLYGAAQLGTESLTLLTLDAPELRGLGQASDTVVVQAEQVALTNTSGRDAPSSFVGESSLLVKAQPVLVDGRTGGITLGRSLSETKSQAVSDAVGQRLAFAQTTLDSTGDIVFDGLGKTEAQGDVTLRAARVTATSSSQQTLDALGTLRIERKANGLSLNESLGAAGKVALVADRVEQGGIIDIESGRLSLTGRGSANDVATVVLQEGSETRVDGRLHTLSDSYAVASSGGRIDVRALAGQAQVNGLLSASAPVLPEGVSGDNPEAGSITLQASGQQGAVVMGTDARLNLDAAEGKGGSLLVDTRALTLSEAARLAAAANSQAVQSGLDKLLEASANASGLAHRRVDIRVREGDVALNTSAKAANFVLSADGGALSVGPQANIQATVPQGGVVQLFAQNDLTLQDGAQIGAQSTREGANGGDVLLSSSQGRVLLGNATVKADSADDALDGRIVVRALQTQSDAGTYTGGMNVALLSEGSGSTEASAPVLQAGRIQLEGVRVYDDTALTTLSTGTSSGSTLGLSSLLADAQSFANTNNQQAILTSLGLQNKAGASVRAGAEVQAAGNFTVGPADLPLNTVRAGGQPLNLTLRAAGDLTVNGSISDGFSTATTTGVVQAGDAASLRFVAGADVDSANLNATQLDASTGHFSLASNKLIRTTQGSMDVHAAGDVRLMAATTRTPSAIYVAGGLSGLAPTEVFTSTTAATNAYRNATANFTERGERLNVSAGGDVGSFASVSLGSDGQISRVAQTLTQLSGNYFFHGGNPNARLAAQSVPVAWWSSLGQFTQGFGSFGGGNIDVMAGGHVSNVAVAAPTNARFVNTVDDKGATVSAGLKVLNGGDVNVQAGGDIAGGAYFLGRGQGRLHAEGSLLAGADALNGGTPSSTQVSAPGAMLALMSGQWHVSTVGQLGLSHVYNPTVVPFNFSGTGNLNADTKAYSGLNERQASVYFTYDSDAGVALSSLAGDVNWAPIAQNFNRMHATSVTASLNLSEISGKNASVPASVLPPVVSVVSLGGDVTLDTGGRQQSTSNNGTNGQSGSALFVMPSQASDVNIYAGRDLNMQTNLQLLDVAQVKRGLPSIDTPALINDTQTSTTFVKLLSDLGALGGLASDSASISPILNTLLENPIADDGQFDNDNLVRLYAARDVAFSQENANGRDVVSFLRSNRPLDMVAGRDIVDPNVIGQNFSEDDVTRLSAGRDIVGSSNANLQRKVMLGGPGQFKVEAGRDMSLNQMLGVLAQGNLINTALPDASAKITLSAGNAKAVNMSELLIRYGDDAALRAAVNQALQDSGLPVPEGVASWEELSQEEAFKAFGALSQTRQVATVQGYLNQEFAATYLPELAGESAAYYRSEAFQQLKQEALWGVVVSKAGEAVKIALSSDPSEEAKRQAQRQALFEEATQAVELAGLGVSFNRTGNINLGNSKVHNLGQGGGSTAGRVDDSLGGIDVIAADQISLGLPSASDDPHGLINFGGGSLRSLTGGDFLVGDQKAIVVGRGNLFIYAADGDIDAGQGSNTAAAKVLPRRRFDANSGKVVDVGQAPTSGAGFQSVQAPNDVQTLVGLYAPKGEIRALDAFIKGGKVEVAAPVVQGADNIANATGAAASPPPAVNLSLPNKPTDNASSTARADDASAGASNKAQANSQLTVELLGFGGDTSGAGDAPCPLGSDPDKCKKP